MSSGGRSSKDICQNFMDNRPFFVRYLKCTELLPLMRVEVEGFDAGTVSQIQERSHEGIEEANELFLQKFEESRGYGKWKSLINILQQKGYEMLHNLLAGDCVNADRERYVKIVQLLTPTITEKIDPMLMLPHLVAEGCINERDNQNIAREVDRKGSIDGAEVLLCRVTRLKDDWFRGFMTALYRTGMTQLCHEIDPDYTAKYLGEAELMEIDEPALQADPVQQLRDSGRRTPTLCSPKSLDQALRDYNAEQYEDVPADKNTLILCPVDSEKRFVSLKCIADVFSGTKKRGLKVVYLMTADRKAEKVWKRCQVYLSHLKSIEYSLKMATQYKRRLSDVVDENDIVVVTPKYLNAALRDGTMRIADFSMVVVEQRLDYFEQQDHDFKTLMSFYHKIKQSKPDEELPQVLLLATSVCGLSPLEELFCTAMETCAAFDIQAIALVRNKIGSLQQWVNMPVMEPPADRRSVWYMAWLKNNISMGCTSNILYCLRLLQVCQNGLFILIDCGNTNAVNYIEREMLKVHTTAVADIPQTQAGLEEQLLGLFQDLRGKVISMTSRKHEDPKITTLQHKLVQLVRENKARRIMVLIKYAIAVEEIYQCLRKVVALQNLSIVDVSAPNGDLKTFSTPGPNLLVTTWPILAFHLKSELTDWDCVIRTDCPGNGFITWQRQVRSDGTPPLSKYSYPGTLPPDVVDLVRDSAIEEVVLKIDELQKEAPGEYNEIITNIRKIKEQRAARTTQNPGADHAFHKSDVVIFCHGCGSYVCNKAHIRRLRDLHVCLDPHLHCRWTTVKLSGNNILYKGCFKLGQFVCRECGEGWGFVVHVPSLGSYPVFAEEGLDIAINGKLVPYSPIWADSEINIEVFQEPREAFNGLTSMFCVDGESIADILGRHS